MVRGGRGTDGGSLSGGTGLLGRLLPRFRRLGLRLDAKLRHDLLWGRVRADPEALGHAARVDRGPEFDIRVVEVDIDIASGGNGRRGLADAVGVVGLGAVVPRSDPIGPGVEFLGAVAAGV